MILTYYDACINHIYDTNITKLCHDYQFTNTIFNYCYYVGTIIIVYYFEELKNKSIISGKLKLLLVIRSSPPVAPT